jgi:hypothetical protein
LLAYPTNFLKRDAGRLYNGYHWLHVKQLGNLYEMTGHQILDDYARQWQSYTERWRELSLYEGVEKTARP